MYLSPDDLGLEDVAVYLVQDHEQCHHLQRLERRDSQRQESWRSPAQYGPEEGDDVQQASQQPESQGRGNAEKPEPDTGRDPHEAGYHPGTRDPTSKSPGEDADELFHPVAPL